MKIFANDFSYFLKKAFFQHIYRNHSIEEEVELRKKPIPGLMADQCYYCRLYFTFKSKYPSKHKCEKFIGLQVRNRANAYTPPKENAYTPPKENAYTPPKEIAYTPPKENTYTPTEEKTDEEQNKGNNSAMELSDDSEKCKEKVSIMEVLCPICHTTWRGKGVFMWHVNKRQGVQTPILYGKTYTAGGA